MTNIVLFQACYCSNIHFNKNLSREKRMKNGVELFHIVYPKFMNGNAVVRNVPVKQNSGRLIGTLGLHKFICLLPPISKQV
jgi:hypothetical protein